MGEGRPRKPGGEQSRRDESPRKGEGERETDRDEERHRETTTGETGKGKHAMKVISTN